MPDDLRIWTLAHRGCARCTLTAVHRRMPMPRGQRGHVWGMLLVLTIVLVLVGSCANDGGDEAQATRQPPSPTPFTPAPPGPPQSPPVVSAPPATGQHCPVCPASCTQCLVCQAGKPCGTACIGFQATCPQQVTCTCEPPTG